MRNDTFGAGSGASATDGPVLGRVIAAAGIGNLVEWFDYSIYGFLAAIIGGVFFASRDPATQLLASFAILAVPATVANPAIPSCATMALPSSLHRKGSSGAT